MGAGLEEERRQRLVRVESVGAALQEVLVLRDGLVRLHRPHVEVHLGQALLAREIVAVELHGDLHGEHRAFPIVQLERDIGQAVPKP